MLPIILGLMATRALMETNVKGHNPKSENEKRLERINAEEVKYLKQKKEAEKAYNEVSRDVNKKRR